MVLTPNRLISFVVLGMAIATPVLAQNDNSNPALNNVSYQLSAEQWANTATANVTVSLDASLDKIGLSNLSTYVLKNLNAIEPNPNWHIVQFTRNQDKSGLETVHIEAQARIPSGNLAALRDKAKNLSKQGETYSISDIDFSPSMDEIEVAHTAARSAIYDKAKQEVARLNQVYPDQHFFLNSIQFMPAPVAPVAYAKVTMAEAPPGEGAQPPVSVDAKVVEHATVVIASVTPTGNAVVTNTNNKST